MDPYICDRCECESAIAHCVVADVTMASPNAQVYDLMVVAVPIPRHSVSPNDYDRLYARASVRSSLGV